MPTNDLVPMMLGFIAIAIASTGTAVAATETVVNIADGTTAANLAKVDANGRLSTLVTGTVTTRPTPPVTTPRYTRFSLDDTLNFMFPNSTRAVVALDHIVVAGNPGTTMIRRVDILQMHVGAGKPCQYENLIGAPVHLGAYTVGAETVIDDFTTPLVLRPSGTSSWCLYAANRAPASSDGHPPFLSLGGYVISGTAPTE